MNKLASRNNITCPFCGLVCDDLSTSLINEKLEVTANGCSLSKLAFAQLSSVNASDLRPRVSGKPVGDNELGHAIAEAAGLLRGSAQPLFSGLMTDVSGMRAITSLADRCGAILDHPNSAALTRNLSVLQNSGWITTTFSEVKNRADLIVLVGTDAVTRFPRFFERLVWNKDHLFSEELKREIVYLGDIKNTQPGVAPNGRQPLVIPCNQEKLGEIMGALRCIATGKHIEATEIAGVSIQVLEKLISKLSNARYGVIVWAVADLDFPHAELTIQSLCELVKYLNKTTRTCGLPLGGNDSDLTANQVTTWQIGFSLPVSLANGRPSYDPHHFTTTSLLAQGAVDTLLWVSSYQAQRTPPATKIPSIVLGCAGMQFENEPDVFIPVATPGLDHSGHIFRSDTVVALPLRQLRTNSLPAVAHVIGALQKLL